MPNTIRIKRRLNGGGAGAPSPMANAELAYNEQTDILYYGKGTGGANGTATGAEAIAGKGAFVDLVNDQSISGIKTFNSLAAFNGADANGVGLRTQWGTRIGSTATAGQFIRFACDPAQSNGGTIVFGSDNAGNAGATPKGSIKNLGTPTAANDAANKAYVDDNFVGLAGTQSISGAKTFTATPSFSAGLAVLGGALSLTNANFTFGGTSTVSVPAPTADAHAATKAYVDSVARGLDWKQSVRAATTTNSPLLGVPVSIDGVAVAAGDRVLVKAQTNAAENGIYIVSFTNWARATDFDSTSGPGGTASASAGATVFVSEGTTLGNSSWTCTTNDTITLGTTPITFTQIAAGTEDTGKNIGSEGVNLFAGKVGNELEIRKLSYEADSGIFIDVPANKDGAAVISIPTAIPLAKGGLGTSATSANGYPLITGGTCTFSTNIPAARGGTNNDLSTAADAEIAVTETSGGTKRIGVTTFGSSVGLLKRTSLGGGAYGYSVDTETYLTDASTIDGGTF